MAVGSGVGSTLVTGVESAYGTAATLDRAFEVTSGSPKRMVNRTQGSGLGSGLVDRGSQRADVTYGGTADLKLLARGKGQGRLFAHALGSSATATQFGTTAAWVQTHALGDIAGFFMSVQSGVPDTGGTVRPKTGIGGKVKTLTIECGAGEDLALTYGMDFRDVVNTVGYTAGTPATANPKLTFRGAAMLAGAYGSETPTVQVRKLTATLTRAIADSLYHYNFQGLKDEPKTNAKVPLGGTLDTTYVDTTFEDALYAGTPISLVATYAGAPIPGSSTVSTTLTGSTAANATQMTLATAVPVGSSLVIDTAGVQEFRTAVAVTGTTVTFDRKLVNAHTSGVAVVATPCFAVQLLMPEIFFDDGWAEITGPDVVAPSFPFTALFDDTHNPFTIVYVSSDTAV